MGAPRLRLSFTPSLRSGGRGCTMLSPRHFGVVLERLILHRVTMAPYSLVAFVKLLWFIIIFLILEQGLAVDKALYVQVHFFNERSE